MKKYWLLEAYRWVAYAGLLVVFDQCFPTERGWHWTGNLTKFALCSGAVFVALSIGAAYATKYFKRQNAIPGEVLKRLKDGS